MIEVRHTEASTSGIQITNAGKGSLLVGYSAIFYSPDRIGSEYRLSDDIVERIKPGAFDRAIREGHDARALFNHDANFLLGRVSSGTCRLSVDAIGLKYEIDIDENDADHARVVAKVNRGDLTGSSFAFKPLKASWEDGSVSIRWIEDVSLYDVGPVVYPAYEGTSVSLDALRSQKNTWLAVQARIRELKLVEMQSKVRGHELKSQQRDNLADLKQKLAAHR